MFINSDYYFIVHFFREMIMCLGHLKEYKSKFKTKTVYKVVLQDRDNGMLQAMYYDKIYEIGKTYEVANMHWIKDCDNNDYQAGIHCFMNKADAERFWNYRVHTFRVMKLVIIQCKINNEDVVAYGTQMHNNVRDNVIVVKKIKIEKIIKEAE